MRKTKFAVAAIVIVALTFAVALAQDAAVTRAIKIIGSQESGNNYACAITDTNGKASLGFMQWNGSRAAALLRAIIAADADGAREILGDELSDRLSKATSCVLTKNELNLVKGVLASDAGKKAQDAKALTDVKGYVSSAKKLGMVNSTAICYYCDIVHQVGSGAIVKYHKLASELAGGYSRITLDDMYNAALKYATYTKARRTRVYNLLKKSPVGEEVVENDKPSIEIVSNGEITLARGQRLALECKVLNCTEKVYWKSSSKVIAKVTQKGVVRGIRKGKVKITAFTESGVKDSVVVTVVKAG